MALLRTEPAADAAQDLALTAAVAAVAECAVVVDAGFERELGGEDVSLQGRMRARGVDTLHVAAGAEPYELLLLARALSHDSLPLPTTPHLRLDLVRVIRPDELDPGPAAVSDPASKPRSDTDRRRLSDRRRWSPEPYRGVERRRGDRRLSGERRLALIELQEADITRLLEDLDRAVEGGAWPDVLTIAARLLDLLPKVPADNRRTLRIAVRRRLTRPALDAMIELGMAEPKEQGRILGVLRWTALDGAEAMVHAICGSEHVGERKFLHDALGAMPDAYPVVSPLLNSHRWYEVRHAAGILARQGRPEAVELLKQRLGHPDERVRAAVVRALADFPVGGVTTALRSALAHESAGTRAAAAEAIGRRRPPGFAMPLVAALARERVPAVWQAMVHALGGLGSRDACTALATIALTRRRLWLGRGYSTAQRLLAVRALAAAGPHSRPALERLVREGDAPIRKAAAEALTTRKA